jgi:hypothetical protein
MTKTSNKYYLKESELYDSHKEYIVMGIYNLMGVKTPEIRVVQKDATPHIASKEEAGFESIYLPDYDFDELSFLEKPQKLLYIFAKHVSHEILTYIIKKNSGPHGIKEFNNQRVENTKGYKVNGIADLMVASAWLSDWDVIGAHEPNIGLITDEKNKSYHIYKFDGDFAIISENKSHKKLGGFFGDDEFLRWFRGGKPSKELNPSLDSYLHYNYNDTYVSGYFQNVMNQVTLEEKKASLKKLFAIKRTDIEAIVNKVSDDVLPQEEKKEIVDYLDARIQKMYELYGDQVYRGSYNERIQGRKTGTWLGVGFGALFAVATGLYLGLKKILEPVYTTLVSIGIAAITTIIGAIAGSLGYDWPGFIGNKIFTNVETREELQKKYKFNCNYMKNIKIEDDINNYTEITNNKNKNKGKLYTRNC